MPEVIVNLTKLSVFSEFFTLDYLDSVGCIKNIESTVTKIQCQLKSSCVQDFMIRLNGFELSLLLVFI